MKTCGTCRFFGPAIVETKWSDEANAAGLEPYVDVVTPFHPCTLIKHDKHWAYTSEDPAVLTDGSGYRAVLCVREEFGCVRWQERTAQTVSAALTVKDPGL